jgi:hypothetical protein
MNKLNQTDLQFSFTLVVIGGFQSSIFIYLTLYTIYAGVIACAVLIQSAGASLLSDQDLHCLLLGQK